MFLDVKRGLRSRQGCQAGELIDASFYMLMFVNLGGSKVNLGFGN